MGKQSPDQPQDDNPLAAKMAELGLVADENGQVAITMLNTVSIGDFSGTKDQSCSCDPLTAVRLVERRYATPSLAEAAPAPAPPASQEPSGEQSASGEGEQQIGSEDGECSQAE